VAKPATGLISNLRILYQSYGGVAGLLKSEYFYVALLFTGVCWRLATTDAWADLAKSVLPTLSGFSIAAYAIFFAVLDESTRGALRAPSPALGDRSPLLIIASAISHAVVVQIAGLMLAIVFSAKPLPTLPSMSRFALLSNAAFSSIGLFITIYGIVLILASILSIFRILEIRSRV
jgi:hypothetical protein